MSGPVYKLRRGESESITILILSILFFSRSSFWDLLLRFAQFLFHNPKKMKSVAAIALVVLGLAVALPRMKRQAFFLPDGVELIVGPINTNFNCDGLRYGYYADVDNNCQIFHVCHPITHADGNQETLHYSFFCGNQTVFNQLTLTCAFPEDAVPCQNARDFYYVNDNIGIEDALFLRDEDVARAQQVIQGKKK